MQPVILALTLSTLFISSHAQRADSDSSKTVHISGDTDVDVNADTNTDNNSNVHSYSAGGTILLLLLIALLIYYCRRKNNSPVNFTQFNNVEDGSMEQNQRRPRFWRKNWRRNRRRNQNQPPTNVQPPVIIQNIVQVAPEPSNPTVAVGTYAYPDVSMPPPNIHKMPPPNPYSVPPPNSYNVPNPNSYNVPPPNFYNVHHPAPPPAYGEGMSVEELENRCKNI